MYQPQSMRVPAASFLVLEKKATAESWKHTLLLTSCQMYIDCYHTNQDPPPPTPTQTTLPLRGKGGHKLQLPLLP